MTHILGQKTVFMRGHRNRAKVDNDINCEFGDALINC